MKTKEMLIKGREILSDRKNWTQGSYARSTPDTETAPQGLMKGLQINSSHPKAVCWCSTGMLSHLAYRMDEDGNVHEISRSHTKARSIAHQILTATIRTMTNGSFVSIENFNDSFEHAKVLEAWDAAIIIAGDK